MPAKKKTTAKSATKKGPLEPKGIGHPNFIFSADFAPQEIARGGGKAQWILKVETEIPLGSAVTARALQELVARLPGSAKDFLNIVEPLIDRIQDGKDRKRVKKMVRAATI